MANGNHDDRIEHVVVLMLENRSFDQMLGDIPNVDGVDPAQSNWVNGTEYKQKPNARKAVDYDPKHLYPNVNFQRENSNANFVQDYWCEYEIGHHSIIERTKKLLQKIPALATRPRYDDIMDYYSHSASNRLGALHTLATEFTVCDHWFSSVPGPTWPNRFFMHSGTSFGYVCMPELPWPFSHMHEYTQTTIYRKLTDAQVSWKIYYHDIPQSLTLIDLWNFKDRFYPIGSFFRDAAGDPNDFPRYSFIEPRYGYGAIGAAFATGRPLTTSQFLNVRPDSTRRPNDDHPPHNVDRGQALVRDVYHSLIGNPRLWTSTLLVLLYDEHGGFYDHIHDLPSAVPPDGMWPEKIKYSYPCGKEEKLEFRFNHLGVRVPAVLVSPWVNRRHVCATTFDHTSILRYVSDKWLRPNPGEQPPYLTKRIEKANSIAECLNGPGPEAPSPPIVLEDQAERINLEVLANQPLNDHQEALIAFTEMLPEGEGNTPNLNPLDRLLKRFQDLRLSIEGPLNRWALATARVGAFLGRNQEGQ
jgi:phospholipase C